MIYNRIILRWLPMGILGTAMMFVVYAAAQHAYRESANDPQVQMVDSAVALLESGYAASSLPQRGSGTVDPSSSLDPFFIVMDEGGRAVISSMRLGQESPVPPIGVLEAAKDDGENRVTWQPSPEARIAAVVRHFQAEGATSTQLSSGYVLAGRSLREVEAREESLGYLILFGWAIAMAASLLSVGALTYFELKRPV